MFNTTREEGHHVKIDTNDSLHFINVKNINMGAQNGHLLYSDSPELGRW